MTNKEKIRAEIERRKKMNILNENKYEEDIDLLSFIDSLPEESVSEDLEEASVMYQRECIANPNYEVLGLQHKADFKAGAQWQKEQMMAKAVGVEVKVDDGGYPYIPQIELYDYDKDIPLAKEGDKYKVVLIKED